MNFGNCRFCHKPLNHVFADLGASPLANSYLDFLDLNRGEMFYPLRVFICDSCFLAQLPEFESPKNIFDEYSFFSSYSDEVLELSRKLCDEMIERFRIDSKSLVIEIASNDGYLLKYFKEKGVPVLGIEPARNVAKVAEAAGIPTIIKYFGTKTAQELFGEGKKADLLIGNNVLAHVPELNDFVAGLKVVLKPTGIVSMEFPHLLEMLENRFFDLIYHEHFSYFSFVTVEKIFLKHGLTLFDVDFVPTHGGSLRILGRHTDDDSKPISKRVVDLRAREKKANIENISTYRKFSDEVRTVKKDLLDFIFEAKESGKTIAGYGAPAKGNTLLNYCGIGADLIDYTVDRSPHKQGKFLPGTHIPIFPPDKIKETHPDYLLILPWNLKKEIMKQMSFIKEWGGQFAVPLPEVKICNILK